MKTYFIDTNVILRFLLHDNEKLYQQAKIFITKAKNKEIELHLVPEVLFEVDYVLRGVYHLTKKESSEIILNLTLSTYLKIVDRKIMINSIKKYQTTNVDLFDLYLFFKASQQKAEVLSFDKDFKKILT